MKLKWLFPFLMVGIFVFMPLTSSAATTDESGSRIAHVVKPGSRIASPMRSQSLSSLTPVFGQNISNASGKASVHPLGSYPETCGQYPDVEFLDTSNNITNHCFASQGTGQVWGGFFALAMYTGSYSNIKVQVGAVVLPPNGTYHAYTTYWMAGAKIGYIYFT